jgi:hypothetical protein
MAYLEEQEEVGFVGSFQDWCQQRMAERMDQLFPPEDLFDDAPEAIRSRWGRLRRRRRWRRRLQSSAAGGGAGIAPLAGGARSRWPCWL